jgi:PAS domain S-box-containing protein
MQQAPLPTGLRTWLSSANRPSQRIARIASSIIILVGCLVLIGWSLDISVLKSIVPGAATMKANTALCFILVGISLGLQTRIRRPRTRLAQGCAIAVLTIGALTLSQYALGRNLGIDQLLFQDDPVSSATSHPGRMGANTAINFVLSGIALWLCAQREKTQPQPIKFDRIKIAQSLTTVVSFIALQAILGYAYNVRVLYQLSIVTTSMALHTALMFGVLCLGIFASKSDRGWMRPLTTDYVGSMVAQRLIPVAIIVPFILGWLVLQGQEANLYDPNFALSLVAVSLMTILVGVIGRTAGMLNQVERDRKRSSDRLRSTEERLQLAIEGAGQGIWDWNLTTQTLTWDEGCKRIFGLPPSFSVTYEWHLNALHPDDRQRVADAAANALRDHTLFDEEYRTFHPDGTLRWVLAKGRGYYDAGEPYRMSGTVLDVSDRKQTELTLAAQTEELIQTNRLKDEFLAALSHELRTPLSPILGWTQMLKNQRLTPEKTVEALNTIDRNVRQQMRLVDDLLEVSRMIQGKLKLELRLIDLVPTLQSAIETVQFAAQAKAILLELRGLPSLPLLADGDRLQQVFWNLLSNAIKFTPEGGRVEVELWVSEDLNHAAQVRVTDTGIGIEPAFLPHVFDRFRQADGSITRKYGGLGLGLSIVRHLVELHGGMVTVESEGIGQGTTFTVKLPLRTQGLTNDNDVAGSSLPVPSTEAIESSQFQPLTTLSGVHILIVDDDPDNLDILQFILQQEGATVTAMSSPFSAIEQIAAQSSDLIISDIGMPELDGYELIQQVRALPQGQQIPALALTAFAYQEDQRKAIEAGFQAYITKPINPIELSEVITQLLHR